MSERTGRVARPAGRLRAAPGRSRSTRDKYADHFVMERRDGIVELRMHTGGGPGLYSLGKHNAWGQAWQEVGEQSGERGPHPDRDRGRMARRGGSGLLRPALPPVARQGRLRALPRRDEAAGEPGLRDRYPHDRGGQRARLPHGDRAVLRHHPGGAATRSSPTVTSPPAVGGAVRRRSQVALQTLLRPQTLGVRLLHRRTDRRHESAGTRPGQRSAAAGELLPGPGGSPRP